MSQFPVDQDNDFESSQEPLLARAHRRRSGLFGGWMISLTLHALLFIGLSRLIEPTLRGIPGDASSDGHRISVVFRQESRKPGSTEGPLDTRLPDVITANEIESPIPERVIKTASFIVQDPEPDSPTNDDLPRETKFGVDDPAVTESAPPAPEPPLESPAPRRVRRPRTGLKSALSERGGTADQPRHTPASSSNGGMSKRPAGRAARGTPGTSFFGVRGNGKKFVYVIDCSGSMSDRETFSRAQRELLTSLDQLPQSALVQVIFYNDEPHALGGGTALLRNTADQRRRISQASRGIVAGGGTNHVPALELALDLDPDALFWLTDADEPYLSSTELRDLTRRNRRRIPIHAIEFGYGPALTADNFLRRAAHASGGAYRYCDLGNSNNDQP